MNDSKATLYTMRWTATKIKSLTDNLKIAGLADDLIEMSSSLLGEALPEDVKPPEPPRPDVKPPEPPPPINESVPTASTKGALWYPKANILKDVKKSAKGNYANRYPQGLVVHFTAGNYDRGQKNAIDSIKSSPYFYLAMGRDGQVVQANPLNEWGYHCGDSAWIIDGKKVTGLSNRLVGLEICNPGRLELINGKYYTWFDVKRDPETKKIISLKNPIDPKDVRIIKKDDDNIQAGNYLPYSKEQEQGLIEFCLWLKLNNPEVFSFDYVLGHDEISGKKGIGYNRKNDPGGALSMNMTQFRELLKKEYAKLV